MAVKFKGTEMQELTWDEFVANVQGWAKERGIYEHSSALAQALKTLSEVGELADAVIKKDIDAAADAIGDICVCIVNYDFMECGRNSEVPNAVLTEGPEINVGEIAQAVGELIQFQDGVMGHTEFILGMLVGQCEVMNLDFMDCCSKAWHEIKDRKGRMVPGGAFVKE